MLEKWRALCEALIDLEEAASEEERVSALAGLVEAAKALTSHRGASACLVEVSEVSEAGARRGFASEAGLVGEVVEIPPMAPLGAQALCDLLGRAGLGPSADSVPAEALTRIDLAGGGLVREERGWVGWTLGGERAELVTLKQAQGFIAGCKRERREVELAVRVLEV